MSGDLSFPSDLADTRPSTEPNPKVWGRRAYAGKSSRELLNDVSRAIAQTDPDHVDDHTDPSLADVIQQAGRGVDPNVKGSLLIDLLGQGLDFHEAVCWYWYRHAQFAVTEIHFAIEGYDHGGDPDIREEQVQGIVDTLRSAASKLDADVDLE